jgi:hypothetical protein
MKSGPDAIAFAPESHVDHLAVGKLRVMPPGHGYSLTQIREQSQISIIPAPTGNKSDDSLTDGALPHLNHSQETLEPPLVVYIGPGSDIHVSSVIDQNRRHPLRGASLNTALHGCLYPRRPKRPQWRTASSGRLSLVGVSAG